MARRICSRCLFNKQCLSPSYAAIQWIVFIAWALTYCSFSNSFVPNLAKMYNKGNYLTIATVTPHPNYTKTKETNDIALVLVNGRFKWSESVKPACLATSKYVTEHKGQLMVSFRISVAVNWKPDLNLTINLLQVTGWGVASYPILNETTRYVLNKPRRPRYLKVAYGRDQSNTSKCLAFGRPVDKSQEVCVRNFTTNSDNSKLDEISQIPNYKLYELYRFDYDGQTSKDELP